MVEMNNNKIYTYIHNLLSELDFTKCKDGKYRRVNINDFMNVHIDKYGFMWVNAELDTNPIEIPITMIKFEDSHKFKDWLIFTYGSAL